MMKTSSEIREERRFADRENREDEAAFHLAGRM